MEKNLAEIILIDSKNRILLQHRTSDAPTYPNQFCIFGGKIEEGEDAKTAVKRECFEELEYNLENPKLILNMICESKYGKRNKYIFMEKYNPIKKLILHEGQNMLWVGKKDYKNLDVVEHDLPVLKKVFNNELEQVKKI